MKVIFPGPNVAPDAADVGQHYPRLGVTLTVGENEVPEEAAKALLEWGHVKPAASAPASPSRLPTSTLSVEGSQTGDPATEPRGARRRAGEEK